MCYFGLREAPEVCGPEQGNALLAGWMDFTPFPGRLAVFSGPVKTFTNLLHSAGELRLKIFQHLEGVAIGNIEGAADVGNLDTRSHVCGIDLVSHESANLWFSINNQPCIVLPFF